MKPQPLKHGQLAEAASFLGQVFRNEKSYQALLSGHPNPQRALEAYFLFFLHLHHPYPCLFYSGEKKIEAFFLFEPPALHVFTLPKMLKAGLLRLVAVAGLGMTRRMAQMGRQFQACRAVAAPGSSCYVGLIAVHPDLQGKGMGNQWMVEGVLPHIRQHSKGLPVVLYTQEPHLVKWYGKFGFVVWDQREISVNGFRFENTTMTL